MSLKYWTLLSGSFTVRVFFDRGGLDQAAVAFVRECGFDGEAVTAENWRRFLDQYNTELEQMGEAPYLCQVDEHEMPAPRAVAVVDENSSVRITSDSPLLEGVELAVIRDGFDENDNEGSDIMEIQVGQRVERFVGHIASIQAADPKLLGGDIAGVFDAVAAKEAGQGLVP